MALRLRGATSGYIELKAPASAGDNTLTLPTNNGSANTFLKTDGSGNLSWQSNLTYNGSVLDVVGNVDINNGTGQAHYEISQTNGNTVKFGLVSGSNIELSGSSNNDFYIKLNGNNERLRITSGGNVDINGTPPWTVTGGDWRNLSISGQVANSGGFLWLGNGAAATNADHDLARINVCNGPTIVSQIAGTTDTSANDDGRLSFHTKKTTGSLDERIRITSNGALLVGTTSPTYGSGDMQHEIKKNNNRAYTAPLMTSHSHLLLNNSDTTDLAFCGLGIRAGSGDGSLGYVYRNAANSADFVINTDGNANGTERFRIYNGGSVLIGDHAGGATGGTASTGSAKLVIDCEGLNVFDGVGAASNYGLVFANDPTTDKANGIGFFNDGGGACGGYIVHQDKGSNNIGDLVFGTSATADTPVERLRIESSGNVKINDGDLVIGTAGKGISFAATSDAGGMTSELFDDYEEGTFTATITSLGGNAATYSAQVSSAGYTRVGSMVHLYAYISDINCTGAGSAGAIISITGLPFSSGGHYYPGVVTHNTIGTNITGGYVQANQSSPQFIPIASNATTGVAPNTGNPKYIMFAVSYFTPS